MTDRRETAPAALLRLENLLNEHGIYPVADWDSGVLTYLHTRNASVSVEEDDPPPRQRYRVEHVNREGNPTRTILVALARVEDVAWLVAVYSQDERRAPTPGRSSAKDEGGVPL